MTYQQVVDIRTDALEASVQVAPNVLEGKRPINHIATVDLISNTSLPVLAADELGLFKAEELGVSIESLPTGVQAVHSGDVDLLADRSVYGFEGIPAMAKSQARGCPRAGNAMAAGRTRPIRRSS
jgi:hypothetical protein